METPRRRILILTPQLPYPPRQGTSIRNYNLIRYLARSHDIDLITFLAPGDILEPGSPLHDLCGQISAVRQPERTTRDRVVSTFTSLRPDMGLRLLSQTMLDVVDRLPLEQYDIVQVEGIEMAPYAFRFAGMRSTQRSRTPPRPAVVFDDHNCEYLLQWRNALTDFRILRRWPAATYSAIQTLKLRRYERRACNLSDLVVAVSEPDRSALQELGVSTPIVTVRNGIDAGGYVARSTGHIAPKSIVFTGKMDYRPNIDAALWFGNQVFPMIQSHVPGAVFQIVGQQPHERLDALRSRKGIEITGAVPEVTPYLEQASVFVIPMRVGGGTRLKALEAMAAGLPIVTTSLGVEGIDVQDGRELLVRDTPEEFASAVVQLLEDRRSQGAVGAALGRTARDFVIANYDWATIIPVLEQAYGEVLS